MDLFTLEVLLLDSMGSHIQIGQALLTIKCQLLDVFNLGSGAVTWTNKKQQAISLSSTEAEYRGSVKAGCEVVWLRQMLGICRCHEQDRPLCLSSKMLSSQHEIQSSMNEPSMWMFTIITYDNWLKMGLQICSMFLPQIRLQTFSPSLLVLISLSNSEDNLVFQID